MYSSFLQSDDNDEGGDKSDDQNETAQNNSTLFNEMGTNLELDSNTVLSSNTKSTTLSNINYENDTKNFPEISIWNNNQSLRDNTSGEQNTVRNIVISDEINQIIKYWNEQSKGMWKNMFLKRNFAFWAKSSTNTCKEVQYLGVIFCEILHSFRQETLKLSVLLVKQTLLWSIIQI